MKPYKTESTKSYPKVYLNFEEGVLEIKGRSFGSAPYKFYNKIKEMLAFVEPVKLTVTLDLDHSNTVSSKNLLELLKAAKEKFYEMEVNWIYDAEDIDLLEVGQTFYDILNVPFMFKIK